MYGRIGKITAREGRRSELVEVLLESVADMPGCLSDVVALDPCDENRIRVTEAWDRRESHQASLSLPGVQRAIERGRALIADFDQGVETTPVGGHGLVPGK